MELIKNDGGRAAAGYKGKAGDCVCRAIAIASGKPYQEVYDVLANGNAKERKTKYSDSSTGVRTAGRGISIKRKWFRDYIASLGFEWVPTMRISTGCSVHLKPEELPMGRLVVVLSHHVAAVINGVLHDTHDCTREETRCVYGYYKLKV